MENTNKKVKGLSKFQKMRQTFKTLKEDGPGKLKQTVSDVVKSFDGSSSSTKVALGVLSASVAIGGGMFIESFKTPPKDMITKISAAEKTLGSEEWYNGNSVTKESDMKKLLDSNKLSASTLLGIASNPNATEEILQSVYNKALEFSGDMKGSRVLLDKVKKTLAQNPSLEYAGDLSMMLATDANAITKAYLAFNETLKDKKENVVYSMEDKKIIHPMANNREIIHPMEDTRKVIQPMTDNRKIIHPMKEESQQVITAGPKV